MLLKLKNCSNSLTMREMQTLTIYHLIRSAKIKQYDNTYFIGETGGG